MLTYIADYSASGLERMRSSRTQIYHRSGDYGFSRVSDLALEVMFTKLKDGSLYAMGLLHARPPRWTYHRLKAVSPASAFTRTKC
jgi:hypothetical protein